MNTQKIVFEKDNNQIIQEGKKFFTRTFIDGENFESGDFNTFERAKNSLNIVPTLEENNILIAKFLGWKLGHPDLFELRWSNEWFQGATKMTNKGYLHFNSDWNRLMSVVEKIESLGFTIDITTCTVYINNFEESFKEIIGTSEKYSKIEAVYNGVVEFINWYNLNK